MTAAKEELGQCSETRVRSVSRLPSYYQCPRKGTLTEDGKPWCWQHAPSAEAKRREARNARWKAESEARVLPYRQVKAGAILAAYVRSTKRYPGGMKDLPRVGERVSVTNGSIGLARDFLIADLFCGAGGTSTGAEKAVRAMGARMVLAAVNHWPLAIETHRRNHPTARHYVEDVTVAKPREIVPGGYLDLLMASPECTYFSRARGGKPIHDQSRMNPWVLQRWVTELDVRCLLIENVPEFQEWGPLCLAPLGHNGQHREGGHVANESQCGRPIPGKKGVYFLAWVKALLELGYEFDYRVLNAADYGDATTRQRFFAIARKDGVPICWPEPSHAPADLLDMFGGRRTRWRAAREIVDWSSPGRSLLDDPKYQKRPLSEKTRRRIARGLERFGGTLAPLYISLLGLESESGGSGQAEPFVCGHRNNNVPKSLDVPIPTATTTTGGGMFLVEPKAEPFVLGQHSGSTPRNTSEPIPTVVSIARIGLIEPSLKPFVLPQGGGGVARGLLEPVPTVACDGAIALVDPVLAQYNGNSGSPPIDSPLPTITTRDRYGLAAPMAIPYGPKAEARSVEQPLPTIMTKDRLAVATPLVVPYYGEKDGDPSRMPKTVDSPLGTITAGGNRFGLLEPTAEPFMVAHFGERDGQAPRIHALADPLPAITSRGGGELVSPCVVQMAISHQAGPGGRSADDPLYTVTTGGRAGLVEPVLRAIEAGEVDPRRVVLVNGVPHLLDIRFRMLSNRELARAMSFDDEEVEYEFVGNSGEITKQIGNAVPVRTATALVTAILGGAA